MTNSLKEQIALWDAAIRLGKLDEVRTAINALNLKRIARTERIQIASICRRVLMYSTATKVLFPVIRAEKAQPSIEEIAEYAASLLRLGSTQEGRTLLTMVKDQKVPEVALYRAFAEIVVWNYHAAVDHLREYLTFPTLSEYQRRVAEVNLAMSYIGSQRFSDASSLLQRLSGEAEKANQILIQATCLYHIGELSFKMNDLGTAKKHLLRVRDLLPSSHQQYHFLNEMHLSMIEAATKPSAANLAAFDQIKVSARSAALPEILRYCDFAKAKWYGDKSAFAAAYAGTPFPSFRAKCLELPHRPPTEILIIKNDVGDVDCDSERLPGAVNLLEPDGLNSGKAVHRALIALCRDFYRPLSLGELYEALYPDTYFDPFTAPDRVHQVIRRLRAWIREKNLGWSIATTDNGFLLLNAKESPLLIPVDRAHLMQNSSDLLLTKIYLAFGKDAFSIDEVIEQRICSISKAHRSLANGARDGYVEKSGHGRYNLYQFIKPPIKAA